MNQAVLDGRTRLQLLVLQCFHDRRDFHEVGSRPHHAEKPDHRKPSAAICRGGAFLKRPSSGLSNCHEEAFIRQQCRAVSAVQSGYAALTLETSVAMEHRPARTEDSKSLKPVEIGS